MEKENKIKMNFDHSKKAFGEAIGVAEERMHEIKDNIYDAIHNSCRKCSKSETIEYLINKLNMNTSGEIFMLGSCFAAIELTLKSKKDRIEQKEMMLNAVQNIDKGISPILDVESFTKAMKNEKNDF